MHIRQNTKRARKIVEYERFFIVTMILYWHYCISHSHGLT